MNDIIEIPEEQKDKGFTLIELLIVIVILGILATVTVFAVSGITDRGGDSACAAELKTIEIAIEAYVAQEGDQPDMADLVGEFLRSASTDYTVDDGEIGLVTDGDGNNTGKCDLDGTSL